MAQILEETGSIESHTVQIYRSSATVKGGRRFSFGALVVVGDRKGRVGMGYAKSKEVPSAIEKAEKAARRDLRPIATEGTTIPHEVQGRNKASSVRLLPASPGTGVVAGGTVRAVLEMAGITDCLTKCYGSTNKLNTIKAVFDGLEQLRKRQDVADLRGVEITTTDIEERIEKGRRFMPKTTGEKMAGPVNTIGQDRRGGGRGGRGGRGGGGRGRGGFGGGGGGGGDRGQQSGGAPAAAGENAGGGEAKGQAGENKPADKTD
ncbi:MAG: 30S ribosomal protein S5 [Planctomycetota bacterium]